MNAERLLNGSKEVAKEVGSVTALSFGRIARLFLSKNRQPVIQDRFEHLPASAYEFPEPTLTPNLSGKPKEDKDTVYYTPWGPIRPFNEAAEDIESLHVENVAVDSADLVFDSTQPEEPQE